MPDDDSPSDGEFERALQELLPEVPVVSSSYLAEGVGCTTAQARDWLYEQWNEDSLDRRKIGGSTFVYYPPGRERNHPEEPLSETAERAVGSSKREDDERVLFFPGRREVAVDSPTDETRERLSRIAHVVDSTDDSYLYKISSGDVWTAAVDSFDELRAELKQVVGEERWDTGFESRVEDDWRRAHEFTLRTETDDSGREFTTLEATDAETVQNVVRRKLKHNDHYTEFLSDTEVRLRRGATAEVKERLYEEGYPAIDERRIKEGDSLEIELIPDIELRDYQREWVDQFTARKAGVFVGPSGSGKTVAALGAMTEIGGETLIIVPNRELAGQWQEELLEKTTLERRQIGQYHGGQKQIRPVTIATYDTAAMSRHRKLFNEREWGLVIADECHHAVADTWKRFREIQSVARLGLSATPVRESGDAKEIFTLIGPPVGQSWGRLFRDDWVAEPTVELLLVPWGSDTARTRYERAQGAKKLIEAARNPRKREVIQQLLSEHDDQKTLIFVDWIRQGQELSERLGVPFVYGETSHDRRETIYQQFRDGAIDALIISRVGDEGIDLPDAEVAILASTMGSSRSQTGQRVGRTMRPMGNAQVYILLTKGSSEEDWGRESTQYLAEKGIDIEKRELDDM